MIKRALGAVLTKAFLYLTNQTEGSPISVTEPVVIKPATSKVAGFVVISRKNGCSLHECSIWLRWDWLVNGKPTFWQPTVSPERRSIGLGGAIALLVIASVCPSKGRTDSIEVGSPSVLCPDRVLSPTNSGKWMTFGWDGTVKCIRTRRIQTKRLSLLKTLSVLLFHPDIIRRSRYLELI